MLCQFLLYSKMNQLYIYIYPLFFLDFLPIQVTTESIEYSSLSYRVVSHQLSTLYPVSVVYICQSQSPNSSHPPRFPPWYPYIIRSEVSQKEKNKYHVLTHICGIQKNGIDDLICKAEIETQVQRTNVWMHSFLKTLCLLAIYLLKTQHI